MKINKNSRYKEYCNLDEEVLKIIFKIEALEQYF